MALDKPDIKLHFDEQQHDAIKIFADLDGKSLKKFCEDIVNEHLTKRIADTNLAHAQLTRLGILGNARDSSGKP